MLTPNQLQALPDSLVALYGQLESEIIADMARRIAKAEYLTDTAAWQSFKVQELKATRAEIIRKLSRITGKSERELKKMFEDAGTAALAYDDEIYKAAGLSPVPLARSKALQAALAAGLKNTKGELRNLTRTTANTASKQFEDALDAAYMRIMSGAFSPQDAIRRAVKALAAEGLQSIRYPSGHTDKIDIAIRRAALTGVNQTAGVLQETRADEMGCDLVQTTSHMGARPEHAVWQGQIFSRSGKHRKYPDFVSSTGYGTGPGLCGWNCHHSFYPFFEGLSADTYTHDTKENRKAYEQSQQQRAYERAIRQSKRELAALDSAIKAAPDEATRAALEAEFQHSASILRRRKDRMEAFLRDTGRTRHTDREQVLGFGRSQSGKAVWATRQAEEAAIYRYVSGESYTLNEKLRSGVPLTSAEQQLADDLQRAILKLPTFEGTVYRSLSSDMVNNLEVFNAAHQPGSSVTYPAFTSTGKTLYDETMDIQLIIKSKTGRDLTGINDAEKEVLLPRGTRFKVIKRVGNTIWLEEI